MTKQLVSPANDHSCFLYALDSLVQKDAVGTSEWRTQLQREVRSAIAIQGRIIITQAQLFDGIELLLLGPAGFIDLVGNTHDTSVIIALAEPSARVALERLTANPTFLWSSDIALREHSDVLSPVSREDLARYREIWADAIDSGEFPSRGYPRPSDGNNFGQNLRSILSATIPDYDVPNWRITDSLLTIERRSSAIDFLDAIPGDTADDYRAWWLNAYTWALASLYDAPWLGGPQATTQHGTPQTAQTTTELSSFQALRQGAADQLARMSSEDFHTLVTRIVNSRIGVRFRHTRLQRLRIYAGAVQLSSPTLAPLLSFGAAIARAASWIVLLLLSITDALGTNIQLGFAIVLIVSTGIAQIPWEDIRQVYAVARSALRPPLHRLRRTGG